MTGEKWVFIVNPVAGSGFAAHYLPALKASIEKHTIDAEIVLTRYQGHATELSGEYASRGYKYIIGVGGDGTLNEICRALAGRADIVTGLVPAGTGNDTVQILGFSDRLDDSHWDLFFKAQNRLMDVGLCNGRIFLNGMGLGFDAQVASENYDKEGKPRKGGKGKYIWHILKNLLFFRELQVSILSDHGNSTGNCFIHTISNGRRFAGGFFLTPLAIADDGLLDVCMIRKLNILQRLQILMMVPKGTHIHRKEVHYYKTESIQLSFGKRVPYHLDGELFFDTKMDVTIKKQAIRIIYNPQGNHYFS